MPLSSSRPLKVSLINRLPIEGFYSLEGYFQRISQALEALGVAVTNHTSPYPSRGVVPRLKIVRFAQRHQGDVTHITGDIHFAALGTDPARTIVTVADCGRLHQLNGVKREVLRQIWFQQPLQRLAAITVISQSVKDDLLRWVPSLSADRVHVVPVSISPQFSPTAKPFPTHQPRILQVGTTANKNIPRLAEALHGLDCTLVVIGRLSAEQERVLAEQQIRYENYVGIAEAEVVEQYQRADLVSFASTLEGFGMPILEAQAVGRPVVTSCVSSMPDVAGEGAELVDPLSVASIRSGIERVLGDAAHRERLIRLGQENIRRFSSEAIAASYRSIYQSVLELASK
ncbi:MAG: glycosyltransferase family 1 protein [Synechococcaceae cyanobacterium]|nr:glycosyltransferase family 1 protein [Synechococcaceae cyanobacterium]